MVYGIIEHKLLYQIRPITKRINITDLTTNQRRELFITCISQIGFIGFTKTIDQQNKQTYYTFYYQK